MCIRDRRQMCIRDSIHTHTYTHTRTHTHFSVISSSYVTVSLRAAHSDLSEERIATKSRQALWVINLCLECAKAALFVPQFRRSKVKDLAQESEESANDLHFIY